MTALGLGMPNGPHTQDYNIEGCGLSWHVWSWTGRPDLRYGAQIVYDIIWRQ